MLELISIILSAVGIVLLKYSLFSFILFSTVQDSFKKDLFSSGVNNSKNDSRMKKSLIILAGSLMLLLFAYSLLSASDLAVFSEQFYYVLFGSLMGIILIGAIVFHAVKKKLPKIIAACSIILADLIVFLSVSIFV